MSSREQRAVRFSLWVAGLNAVPSVLWSVLCIVPVYAFCARFMSRAWLYGFGAASLLPYAFPLTWFRYFELSFRLTTYRRFGVPLANLVTQNGGLVNRFVRRRYPNTCRALDARAMTRLERVTYDQERFHMMGFLFFFFTAFYAAVREKFGWLSLLLLCNVAYNVYPIWLQQYVRLRLRRVGARRMRMK